VQGVPLNLGEYNLLNFQAFCKRVTQQNLNLRFFASLTDDCIAPVILFSQLKETTTN
jgi:hypothetical protein